MSDELREGSVLFIVILVIILLFGVGVGYLTLTLTKSTQTTRSIQTISAYEIAEAGLDMARTVLLSGHGNSWDDELVTSANNRETYNPDDPSIDAGTDTSLFQWARDISYHGARYWGVVYDNDDGDGNRLADCDDKVNIRVRAFFPASPTGGPGGNETIVNTLCQHKTPVFEPQTALLIGGSLEMSGNPTVQGTNGTVYANGDIYIGGNPDISQDLISTGTITNPEKATVGGDVIEGASPADAPEINPVDYKHLAGYILKTDGWVYDSNNNPLWDTVKDGPYRGWQYAGSNKWQNVSDSAYDGTYYFEGGNVEISSNPGTAENPWKSTILATGYIDVSGNPTIEPHSPGVILMARGDIAISGNPGYTYEGLIASHEQIKVSGNPQVNGSLYAEDYEDVCDFVSTGSVFDVTVSGSATMTFNGGLTTFIESGNPYVAILGTKKEK